MCPTTLTTDGGAPVADNQNSRTSGRIGPIAIDDVLLIEKLAHFNRENIPERRVHAKGAAAYGTFTVTNDISRLSRAALFSSIGKQTPIFTRFSSVIGSRGSADTVINPRGFSVKFYTEQGNWDLVGNNTPVFFIRDPIKFPDFIHSEKPDPQTNLPNAEHVWDFLSLSPESLHQVTILFSDRAIPDGFRHMHGFGSHTFSLLNNANTRTWVKWHFETQQGIKNLTTAEGMRLAGADPDYATRDLFNAIDNGNFPKWTVRIQTMTEAQADASVENPFDVTKIWPHAQFPLRDVGVIELNHNVQNYHAEVEQSAFCPANVVPGIGLSPDRMLQGRVFAYPDAQRYRIGTNYQQLPINAPLSPAQNYQRDGAMALGTNGGASLNYEPNSDVEAPKQDSRFVEPLLRQGGATARYNHRVDNDYYSHPRALFNLMTPAEKAVLFANIGGAMAGVSDAVVLRQLTNFAGVSAEYAQGVAAELGIPWP
ncbi:MULTISPECIES: catalase [Pseudomonas fluorescens group]|uniref:Catalase n=1 Tax=Pseudomonas fluorescens TaxID=294 RepID=A0AAE2Q3F3_PSEFL|nr:MULTISPECIES: catalase [Pseudomonas fluorescens group]MBA1429944.1 catalase [Pseudomonas orientalis]MBD8272835.1 catalase [Pseudomonas fluorescens]MDF2795831.1 catalase [Pseudomonas orientalis]